MRRLAAAVFLAAAAAACGDGPAAAPTRPAVAALVESTSIEIPARPDGITVGETLQLQLFATFVDGTRQNVTRDALWTVIDERVVRIAPGGVATAVGVGATGIFASYHNVTTRIGVGIRVVHSRSDRVPLTVVVRDERGGVAGARVTAVADSGEQAFRLTDGNGFADFGSLPGFATFTTTKIGYADATTVVSGLIDPTRLTIRLVEHPGSFIERRVEQYFDAFDYAAGEAVWQTRIATRYGGLFDAAVESDNCDYNGTVRIVARSAGLTFTSVDATCYGRLRFVVPDEQVELTVRGYKATSFRLTYREPR